jgi:hypothetical protein
MFFVRARKHYQYYQAILYLEFIVILAYLFQENKSFGNKPFHSSSDATLLYVAVTSGTVIPLKNSVMYLS